MKKQRAPRNRTLALNDEEKVSLTQALSHAVPNMSMHDIINKTFNDDLFKTVGYFPRSCVDLMIVDPPYNLHKDFNGYRFTKSDDQGYADYLEQWFPSLVKLLKPSASVYICGDWRSTSTLYQVVSKYLVVRNRITWQREKGRGAKTNWKNCTEDIWFATVSDDYFFDVEAVKVKRRVIAPYKENGKPKDWEATEQGNFRLTHPSNFWDDITIPYWSMPENTDHPTQKPEKLIAKLILASCPKNGFVFDPFLGSGTTSVVASKLGRTFCGVELNEEYCCWALKRLERAGHDRSIQGYSDGVFWERNTLSLQKTNRNGNRSSSSIELSLFEVSNAQ
jgi:site-specific DNA-methyltransferase (adenine-specific)